MAPVTSKGKNPDQYFYLYDICQYSRATVTRKNAAVLIMEYTIDSKRSLLLNSDYSVVLYI